MGLCNCVGYQWSIFVIMHDMLSLMVNIVFLYILLEFFKVWVNVTVLLDEQVFNFKLFYVTTLNHLYVNIYF